MSKVKNEKRTPFRVWYFDGAHKECRRIDGYDVPYVINKMPKKFQNTIERIVDLSDGQVHKPPFS